MPRFRTKIYFDIDAPNRDTAHLAASLIASKVEEDFANVHNGTAEPEDDFRELAPEEIR
jgi:hypothetical protein